MPSQDCPSLKRNSSNQAWMEMSSCFRDHILLKIIFPLVKTQDRFIIEVCGCLLGKLGGPFQGHVSEWQGHRVSEGANKFILVLIEFDKSETKKTMASQRLSCFWHLPSPASVKLCFLFPSKYFPQSACFCVSGLSFHLLFWGEGRNIWFYNWVDYSASDQEPAAGRGLM